MDGKKALEIVLGGILMIGSNGYASATGDDAAGGGGPESQPGRRSRAPEWFRVWTNVDDISKYSDLLMRSGPDCKYIDVDVIQRTYTQFGLRHEEDGSWTIPDNYTRNLQALCVFTCALYSLAHYVLFWYNDISSVMRAIVENIVVPDGVDVAGQSFTSPVTLQDYMVRLAWLLFLSQTVDGRGEGLRNRYEGSIIGIAKELLEKQKSTKERIAKEMIEKIENVENKGPVEEAPESSVVPDREADSEEEFFANYR
ncbi:MAG: hypothetical protein LBB05_01130 [Puniceicoccales bacterium]|jgi:hypothetical protein|nr:hypothetical protein [Puniceicoccales bacterium]